MAETQEKRKLVKLVLRTLITNFLEHDVGKNAAALAYYLLFALFPMLIFLSNVLGLLKLDITSIIQVLQRILPNEIVGIVESYLEHVSHTSSPVLLWFALIFSIWFPMRAAKGLMDDVRLAYHLDKPANPIAYAFRQLAYTVVLLLVIGLTLLLSVLGKQMLGYINYLIPESTMLFSGYFIEIWQYLRFVPVALLMYAALGTLYAASLDKRQPVKNILPGIVVAMTSWMIVSIGFSFYVENFANFSVIYGTLGAMIVLLMWVYMTAEILILGAELNAAILESIHYLENDNV